MSRTLLLLFLACTAVERVSAQSCDFSKVSGVIWWGTETRMPVSRFAAYIAPILWFSSDEPSLLETSGLGIRVPEALPQETKADRPVMYYQLNLAFKRPDAKSAAVLRTAEGGASNSLDLTTTAMVILKYFAYFPTEEGLGAHPHDIEPAEFRVVVLPHTWDGFKKWLPRGVKCAAPTYVMAVTRVSAQAHGLVWFWNVLDTDDYTQFPMHLLVEEGKHALATDKNGDGVFTRGYDVNVRINDAWGARDIIRTGKVFSGGYESWMTKVRRPEYRILPPLPDDSPLRGDLRRRVRGTQNVVYELRPFPPLASAGEDHGLVHLMQDKVVVNWPKEEALTDAAKWRAAVGEGAVVHAPVIANPDAGAGGDRWGLPMFGAQHLAEPTGGGDTPERQHGAGGEPRGFGGGAL